MRTPIGTAGRCEFAARMPRVRQLANEQDAADRGLAEPGRHGQPGRKAPGILRFRLRMPPAWLVEISTIRAEYAVHSANYPVDKRLAVHRDAIVAKN